MNTALIYLPITVVMGFGLFAIGSRGWLSCLVISVGLALMIWHGGSSYPWLTAFVVWSVAAALLTFWTGAPWMACAFCALSALSYLLAMFGGDPKATVWISNGFGVAMLLALMVGGTIEFIGRSRLSDSGAAGRLAVVFGSERTVPARFSSED